MVHHSHSEEIEVKVSAKRIYHAVIQDGHNFYPKSAGDKVASVEYDNSYNEHEGLKVGTERTIKFHDGFRKFGHIKEKVEFVDHEKLHVKFHVLEGGFGPHFKHVKVDLEFKEGVHPGTAIIKYKAEYESIGEGKEFPEEEKQAWIIAIKSAEAYLLEHDYP